MEETKPGPSKRRGVCGGRESLQMASRLRSQLTAQQTEVYASFIILAAGGGEVGGWVGRGESIKKA